MRDYFREAKKRLEKAVPEVGTTAFTKTRNKIREELKKEQGEFLLLISNLKVLILGDWYNEEKMKLLYNVKNSLLKNRIYAETIDFYHDISKGCGLSQISVLTKCCTTHQLIVFIDGDGKGTLCEQAFLADRYHFHKKYYFS